MDLKFQSRRSDVLGLRGCVSCNEPIASKAGLDILQRGGNAADAAVATAAVLAVTEPMSTGLGGDAFCLFYDASTKKVRGLNGSGRSPAALNLNLMHSRGFGPKNPPPPYSALTIDVPGAPAAWLDTWKLFGSKKISLEQILAPAISVAENGFPVTQVTGQAWTGPTENILRRSKYGSEILLNGRAPKIGEIMKNPFLASTLKEIILHEHDGFYRGRVAEAIVQIIQSEGGVMSMQDLANHKTEEVSPISTTYKGVRLWECPPNGQGITALMALNILENFDLKSFGFNSAEYLHLLIEAFKLSFADTLNRVTDPEKAKIPLDIMLNKDYAMERSRLINPKRALNVYLPGNLPNMGSDTTYFSVVDQWGNACSFINSIFLGMGTGIVPQGCGFSLQNRGLCFNLDPSSPNVVAPNKRPYHTIIPAMLTDTNTGNLLASYGIMGGFMQPQAHVQVLLAMKEFHFSPQQALDQSRFLINIPGLTDKPLITIGPVLLEEGIEPSVYDKLRSFGHEIVGPVTGYSRNDFGRGHVITHGAWWASPEMSSAVANDPHVIWAGTDSRSDGIAYIH